MPTYKVNGNQIGLYIALRFAFEKADEFVAFDVLSSHFFGCAKIVIRTIKILQGIASK